MKSQEEFVRETIRTIMDSLEDKRLKRDSGMIKEVIEQDPELKEKFKQAQAKVIKYIADSKEDIADPYIFIRLMKEAVELYGRDFMQKLRL